MVVKIKHLAAICFSMKHYPPATAWILWKMAASFLMTVDKLVVTHFEYDVERSPECLIEIEVYHGGT